MSAHLDELDEREIATLRIPPHSVEAEQSVLASLMVDASAFDQVGDVLSEVDFYRFDHRTIFAAAAQLLSASKPADMVSLFEALRDDGKAKEVGGLPYLNALCSSITSATHARRWAEIVREKSMARALIATLDNATSLAWRQVGKPVEMVQQAVTMLDELQRSHVKQGPRAAHSLLPARLDHYSDMAAGNVPTGYPTGIADLDRALNGGLQHGRVYVLAARPSVGKSSLAMQIGLHRAKHGDGVLLLSQEMPAEECIDRAVANIGRVDYGRMQRAAMVDVDWAGVTDAADALKALPLWIDDQPGLTLRDIRSKAYALRSDGLKLLVIDYLQLCAGSGVRGTTRNSDLEEIMRGLKTLAKQLRISVLVLSQLSREVEKRASPEPNLGDLRDSGAIEQDADCVLFLWFFRQWSERKLMGLGIAKNRQGERGQRIPLEFLGQHQRWLDSNADISPQQKHASHGEKVFE